MIMLTKINTVDTYKTPQFTGALVSFGVQNILTVLPNKAYTGVETDGNTGTIYYYKIKGQHYQKR